MWTITKVSRLNIKFSSEHTSYLKLENIKEGHCIINLPTKNSACGPKTYFSYQKVDNFLKKGKNNIVPNV